MSATYTIYGGELSYFTRKLEAAMKFYGANFFLRPKTPDNSADIEKRSGTHQVPVLHTPENWMIGDTTPLMMLLDSRFPDRRMFPDGPLGVLVHVVEEYFDEWIARTMVHYRWHYQESAEFASIRMANGVAEAAERVRNWGPRACRATGTESEVQQRAAEEEYVRILEAAEKQLSETPYLLGDRPTAVDCIVLGGLRAHTYMDPTPKKVTANYPKVIEWTENGADRWDGNGELAPFPDSTPFAQFVLKEMVSTYQPYVMGNQIAQEAGIRAFTAHIYDEDVSYLSRPYPEFARQMIVDRIQNRLSAQGQERISSWLEEKQLNRCFGS
ncbi:MAG: glutathione S-transferase family protein [Pseudomonadota bacterium]